MSTAGPPNEAAIVHGVRLSLTQAVVTVAGSGGRPVGPAGVLRTVADLGVPIGAVAFGPAGGVLVFTVARTHAPLVDTALRAAAGRLGIDRPVLDTDAAELALHGAGLRSAPAIVATFCEALAGAGVGLDLLAQQSRRISVVCGPARAGAGARALCTAFEVGLLDPPAEPRPPAEPCPPAEPRPPGAVRAGLPVLLFCAAAPRREAGRTPATGPPGHPVAPAEAGAARRSRT